MYRLSARDFRRTDREARVDATIHEMRERWAPDLISAVEDHIVAEWTFARPRDIPSQMDLIAVLCRPEILPEATAGHPYYEFGIAGRYDREVRLAAIAILEEEMFVEKCEVRTG